MQNLETGKQVSKNVEGHAMKSSSSVRNFRSIGNTGVAVQSAMFVLCCNDNVVIVLHEVCSVSSQQMSACRYRREGLEWHAHFEATHNLRY